jgi:hypothetical protein
MLQALTTCEPFSSTHHEVPSSIPSKSCPPNLPTSHHPFGEVLWQEVEEDPIHSLCGSGRHLQAFCSSKTLLVMNSDLLCRHQGGKDCLTSFSEQFWDHCLFHDSQESLHLRVPLPPWMERSTCPLIYSSTRTTPPSSSLSSEERGSKLPHHGSGLWNSSLVARRFQPTLERGRSCCDPWFTRLLPSALFPCVGEGRTLSWVPQDRW